MRSVMTLGRLINMEIYDPQTKKTRTVRKKGAWVVTTNGKDLKLAYPKSKKRASLNGAAGKRHRKFHGEAPRGAWAADLPSPGKGLKQIGLLKALTYSVPKGSIKSPEKNPYHWHHSFGDTGHETGERAPEYPPKYYPAVLKDSKGNLFIRRRNGNIFRVTDWIIG